MGMSKTGKGTLSAVWDNHLRAKRMEAGWLQGELAKRVGLTRQAFYAIESNHHLPSTEVSLRLARILQCSVEDLFHDKEVEECVEAEWVGPVPRTHFPIRAKVARVGKRFVARPVSTLGEWLNYTVPADGLVYPSTANERPHGRSGHVRVQLLQDRRAVEEEIFVAGCDPSIFLAGAYFRRCHGEASVVGWTMGSVSAVEALKRGEVHMAGLHLVDRRSGQSNVPYLKRHLPRGHFTVFRFVTWQQGLMIRRGNPKGISQIEDVGKPGVRWVNRERGSGARRLLDNQLTQAGLPSEAIKGYQREVGSHLDVARHILEGEADAGIGVESAAKLFDLDFVPLQEEHYDFVFPTSSLHTHPLLSQFLDTLMARSLRKELDALGGYDTSDIGAVIHL